MGMKLWITRKILNVLDINSYETTDSGGGASRDPALSVVKRVGLRSGDVTSKDFEDPEFDLSQIQLGYLADSYIRQGVDKYVDQIFKEGFEFYGKNEQAVEYLKLRFAFIAEATQTPTAQLFTDIAEDVVKYSNCFLVKARAKDLNSLPPGVSITGLGGAQPVAGYFCLNATTIKTKRDRFGTVTGYQQETPDSDKPIVFKPTEMIHFAFKREKGSSFGTPFLWPVLDDVRSLRQAEENVLRMMYRNIHPFNHVTVGTDEIPGTPTEIEQLQEAVNNMEVDGGIVTSNRVKVNPIASDNVIDAHPYLQYLEARVFSGIGVPAILFGRGATANRSTGDSMTTEMGDRIKAIQRTIEYTINDLLIRELLLEGGYDPVLNTEDVVEFKFKDNDMDRKIKHENHCVYKFEHNAITEDEMRLAMNMDPIVDRALLQREIQFELSTRSDQMNASPKGGSSAPSGKEGGTKATNNKNKPTNQHGTKLAPKKSKDAELNVLELLDFNDSIISDMKKGESSDGYNNN